MKEYVDITVLDATTLHTLVKEIIVHEEMEGTGNRYHTMRKIWVEIHFNLKPIPELVTVKNLKNTYFSSKNAVPIS